MKCGYCGTEYNDATPHYCVEGRDFLMRENARLREALRAAVLILDGAALNSAAREVEEIAEER